MGHLAGIFGKRVNALRTAKGLTQAQLAERAHVSEEWLRRVELGNGAPSLNTIEAVASALDASIGDLFDEPASSDTPYEGLIAAAKQMTPDELAWLEQASRLVLSLPRSGRPT